MHIDKSTLFFLRELQENNSREWFQDNKERYELAIGNFKNIVEEFIDKVSDFDPHINRDIQASKCLFRIYRDIRFSKDKTPYKTWFSAGISIDGRKLDGPEYYIHLEPNKSFLAAGYWRPGKDHLEAIRQEIDYSSHELHLALEKGGWSPADLSTEDKLKRPPVGYNLDHPDIELLKLKSFIIYGKLSDEEVTGVDLISKLTDIATRMNPFKQFIHQALV